jgi:hypothetical protein
MGIEVPKVEAVFVVGKGEAREAWSKGHSVCTS